VESATPPLRILLVEDDAMVRRLLHRSLESWFGPSIHVAHDGRAALLALEEHRFDLVLTDLKIPGPDGLEVARAAREQEPPAAVVVVTGHAEEKDEARITGWGAWLLRKPFDPGQLEATLRTAIERARGE